VSVLTLPLKVNHCFAVLDDQGFTHESRPRVTGFLLHDTRHLSRYAWDFSGFDLIEGEATLNRITQYWSLFEHHEQALMVRRQLDLRADGFDEMLDIRNETAEARTFTPRLDVAADFIDCFEMRGRVREIGMGPVEEERRSDRIIWRYVAQDGIESATELALAGFENGVALTLPPGSRLRISVTARFRSGLMPHETESVRLPWTEVAQEMRKAGGPALRQAMADIEALAAETDSGPFVMTGIPNYVTVFGRDSLLTSWFLLGVAPGIAAGTLRHLATVQGQIEDPVRQEEPGKIPHEIRVGELSRMNDVPFARYYGTTDATMLYVILMRDHARATGSTALVTELQHHWRAALDWTLRTQGPDGLIRYRADRVGKGLTNTSWKDSDDSVSYADGRLPHGRIAVVEMQGYAAEAFEAAADLIQMIGGDAAEAAALRTRAADLRARLDKLFWNDRLGLHVIALDEDGMQCDTATSNPGHLLWAGALTPDRAAQLAARMMQPDLWSGWGLRTLSEGEVRYRPLSYHNGSVWPHDTALFAAGLVRYGMADKAAVVTGALTALAERQPGYQMPELCGGYARDGDTPPLIYIETCRPQAWAAAAMIWAATRDQDF
jgi:glycogen debranching enzyme